MIASGSALGGLFAGLVVNATHGWRFTFWMNATLTGTSFLLITLFQPETNFFRSPESETGQGVPLTDSNTTKTKYSFLHNLGVTSWYDR
jgi:MFS family permease